MRKSHKIPINIAFCSFYYILTFSIFSCSRQHFTDGNRVPLVLPKRSLPLLHSAAISIVPSILFVLVTIAFNPWVIPPPPPPGHPYIFQYVCALIKHHTHPPQAFLIRLNLGLYQNSLGVSFDQYGRRVGEILLN